MYTHFQEKPMPQKIHCTRRAVETQIVYPMLYRSENPQKSLFARCPDPLCIKTRLNNLFQDMPEQFTFSKQAAYTSGHTRIRGNSQIRARLGNGFERLLGTALSSLVPKVVESVASLLRPELNLWPFSEFFRHLFSRSANDVSGHAFTGCGKSQIRAGFGKGTNSLVRAAKNSFVSGHAFRRAVEERSSPRL
jgi:hypothetical protein